MFMGEYNHTIDAKNRLIIPSKFREALGDEFVVTKGLDGCLFVYDNKEWCSFEEKLRSLPLTNKDARTFVRFFLAGAASVEVDKQGRVLIPSVLKEFAGINKEVTLIGLASRIMPASLSSPITPMLGLPFSSAHVPVDFPIFFITLCSGFPIPVSSTAIFPSSSACS